ncbi:hypothetical protein [Bartonella sp. AC90GZZY]|uniref:hypothetical protein n=1 Tax=Bartonella sp. AC90GZZY TaxID=3243461 RepID=UPI0035D07CCE
MHETYSHYKSDTVSQKSISQKSTLFPIILLVRAPRVKPSHKIVFKGTSKAIERRCEVRGTIYRLIQKSLSQAVF